VIISRKNIAEKWWYVHGKTKRDSIISRKRELCKHFQRRYFFRYLMAIFPRVANDFRDWYLRHLIKGIKSHPSTAPLRFIILDDWYFEYNHNAPHREEALVSRRGKFHLFHRILFNLHLLPACYKSTMRYIVTYVGITPRSYPFKCD